MQIEYTKNEEIYEELSLTALGLHVSIKIS